MSNTKKLSAQQRATSYALRLQHMVQDKQSEGRYTVKAGDTPVAKGVTFFDCATKFGMGFTFELEGA